MTAIIHKRHYQEGSLEEEKTTSLFNEQEIIKLKNEMELMYRKWRERGKRSSLSCWSFLFRFSDDLKPLWPRLPLQSFLCCHFPSVSCHKRINIDFLEYIFFSLSSWTNINFSSNWKEQRIEKKNLLYA